MKASSVRHGLWLSSYGLVLAVSYNTLIEPRWSYFGYVVERQPGLGTYALICLYCFAMGHALRPEIRSASDLLRLTAVTVVAIPSVSIGIQVLAPLTVQWVIYVTSLTVAIIVSTGGERYLRWPRVFDSPRVTKSTAHLTLIGSCLGSLLIIIIAVGIRNPVGLLIDPLGEAIYATRYESRAVIVPGSLTNTVLFSSTRVIFPIALAGGWLLRDRRLFILSIAGQVLAFGQTAHKTPLLWTALCLVGFIVLNKAKPARLETILKAVLSICLLGSLLHLVGIHELSSLIVRRTFSNQGLASAIYFEFFSSHNPAELRHSVLSFMGDYAYDLPKPAFVIGREYFGDERISANASAWVDGFANFRLWGVALVSLILAFYVSLLDRVTAGLPPMVMVAALFPIFLAISNTSVFTLMTTHGGAIAPLLLATLRAAYLSTDISADHRPKTARSQPVAGDTRLP